MNSKTQSKTPDNRIAINRRARHDYFIEETYEAGMVLQGWEVKSLRSGHAQLQESYVIMRDGEAWLFGSHIPPLLTASTHVKPDPLRTRKLLLNQRELSQLIGLVERRGYTIVPLDLHWKRGRAKLTIGLAKGKQGHDKRADQKNKDWQREKSRILKSSHR